MDPEIKGGYVLDFHVKQPSDQNPVKIIRMLCLDDDRVLVSDFGNKALKLFSEDYEYLTSHHMTIPPQGMCYVNDDTIALCFVSHIEFLKIVGSKFVHLPKDIELPDRFLNDIAYIGDGEFIITCENRNRENEKRVYMDKILESRKVKNLMKIDDNLTINSFLHSHTNNLILYGRRDLLKCFNISGIPRWELTVPSLRGIISFKNELMAVSYRDNAVYQISRAGDLKKEPVIDRVINPEVLCHQKNRKRILVSESSTDIIHVFRVTEMTKY